MVNKGDVSHSKKTYEIDGVIVELQEQFRKLTQELEQVRGSTQRDSYHQAYDVNPIDIAYSSSHGGFNNEEGGM